jgi:hypothetical protein
MSEISNIDSLGVYDDGAMDHDVKVEDVEDVDVDIYGLHIHSDPVASDHTPDAAATATNVPAPPAPEKAEHVNSLFEALNSRFVEDPLIRDALIQLVSQDKTASVRNKTPEPGTVGYIHPTSLLPAFKSEKFQINFKREQDMVKFVQSNHYDITIGASVGSCVGEGVGAGVGPGVGAGVGA